MRIAFISMFEKDYGGGAGRVAHDMAVRFAADHDVAMVCPGNRTAVSEAENGLCVLEMTSVGEGHVRVPSLSTKNLNRMYDFLDEFRPDVVHAHDPISIGLIGQIWAKMHGVPFMYTSHVLPTRATEFGAIDAIKILSTSLAESVTMRALANFYKNCDGMIALNEPAAADIAKFGHGGRLFMIPNGRDVSRFGACRIADLTSPERVLTFVGLLNQRKNQRFLVEMLTHLPSDFRLQLVGDTLDAGYGRQLKELIQRQGLQNVDFTGPVSYDEIPDILERTHVFVSASKMEVQSLVIVEALASGTPVVGLANETIDELVDDEVGCRVERDAGAEAFAARVRAVCDLPAAEYERLCRHARQRVAHLDWPNVVQMTIDAYETLLREQPLGERRGVQVSKIIAFVPSEEVREALEERLAWVEKTAQRTQVSGRTWLWVGLARAVSSVVTFIFGPVMRLWTKVAGARG